MDTARFEGTIDQYTGDGIMALFGAPIAHEDHARRAGYAAVRLREDLRRHGRSGVAQRACDLRSLALLMNIYSNIKLNRDAVSDMVADGLEDVRVAEQTGYPC